MSSYTVVTKNYFFVVVFFFQKDFGRTINLLGANLLLAPGSSQTFWCPALATFWPKVTWHARVVNNVKPQAACWSPPSPPLSPLTAGKGSKRLINQDSLPAAGIKPTAGRAALHTSFSKMTCRSKALSSLRCSQPCSRLRPLLPRLARPTS